MENMDNQNEIQEIESNINEHQISSPTQTNSLSINTNYKNLNVHFNQTNKNNTENDINSRVDNESSNVENDNDSNTEDFEDKKEKNEEESNSNSINSDNQDEEEYEDEEDDEEDEDDEFQTVKDRQEAINVSHPFGLRLWKPALYKKHRSIFTTTHKALHSQPGMSYSKTELYLHPGNILWAITFGWSMALIYLSVTLLGMGSAYIIARIYELVVSQPISLSPKPKQSRIIAKYMKLLLNISGYIFWPFGKYIERIKGNISDDIDYYAAIHTEQIENDRYKNIFSDKINEIVGDYSRKRSEHFSQKYTKNKLSVRRVFNLLFKNGFSGFVFYLIMFSIIGPMHLIVSGITWIFVVSIPMCKLNYLLLTNLLNDPLELYVHSSSPPPFQFHALFKKIHHTNNEEINDESVLPLLNTNDFTINTPANTNTTPGHEYINNNYQLSGQSEIILCTYKAIGFRYYKYTLEGINVIFINSLLFVVFTLLDAYFIAPRTDHAGIGSPSVIFISSLISVIPLAYFIGMSVSSITAQTNLALGAVINATFGSIIEVILYSIALNEGKAKIVEGSLIGSILAGILALPGMSMLTGGMKRKEQRFNAKSAGVSSTLLILSIIGVFTPTLFQIFFGSYNLECKSCPEGFGTISNNATFVNSTEILSTNFENMPTLIKSNSTSELEKAFMLCENCRYVQPDPLKDGFYYSHTRPLVWFCAVMLILTYSVGLLFTLRTHVKQIYEKRVKQRNRKRSRSRTGRSRTRQSKSGDRGTSSRHRSSHGYRNSSVNNTPISSVDKYNMESTSGNTNKDELNKNDQQKGYNDDIIYNSNGKAKDTYLDNDNENKQYYENLIDLSMADNEFLASTSATNTNADEPITKKLKNLIKKKSIQEIIQMERANQINMASSSLIATENENKNNLSLYTTLNIDNPSSSNTPQTPLTPKPDQYAASVISSGSESGSEVEKEAPGHEAPSWSKLKSTIVLLVSTITFSLLAEVLIASVDVVLKSGNIDEKFLGITLFALAPNVSEFYNAIAFAMYGNIELSLEIGSAYAIQVAMLQIPSLVMIYSITQLFFDKSGSNFGFSLIFSKWDVVTTVIGVFLLSHIYTEGKSNYFKGAMLLLAYLVFVMSYYFIPGY